MQQAILGDAAAFPSVAAAAAAGWWRGREAAAGLAFAPFAPLDASVFGLFAELQDLLPGIINQLGPDNLANLKKLAETYQGGTPPPAQNVRPSGPPLSTPPPSPPRAFRGPRAHHTPERHPLTPSARAQNEMIYFPSHRQPAARRERG